MRVFSVFFFFYLRAGGVMEEGRGDEEDELAAGDGRSEGGGVVEVGLEQAQPLRRRVAGDEPPQEAHLHLVPYASQGGVHGVAGAEELLDEPRADEPSAAGDAHPDAAAAPPP